MAQSTSSSRKTSLSQPSSLSPSQSVHRQQWPTNSIEPLIAHLVVAKRSLSSIHHVHRATTILSEARVTIESTAVSAARTKYLRRSLGLQLKILRGIQFELENAAQAVKLEFHATLNELNKIDQKLAENIHYLKSTRVEDGFKMVGVEQAADDGTKNSLHDFVDDMPVEELKNTIQASIDAFESAEASMDQSIRMLEDDLQTINQALSDRTASSSSSDSTLPLPNVTRSLRDLETHAREMAESLESLVKHFDLCVTAIKHTEGGGAAVAQNLDTRDLPEGVSVDAFDAPAQSITEDERAEMLQVLENDAAEVDDVVIEIQERAADMEAQLERLITWREFSEGSSNDVSTAFGLLEKVGDRLSNHVAEASRFSTRWNEEKLKIEDGIAGMDELCEVYERFLNAYDGMIVEAARRKTVRKRMDKIVQEAQSQLNQLYEDDLNERDVFRTEQGDFLPSDIWRGLNSLPAQFAVQRLDEETFGSVPDLPKETVAGALKRLKAAQAATELEQRQA